MQNEFTIDTERQKRVIDVLAHCDGEQVFRRFSTLKDIPQWTYVRKPETGLVMVRGRMGGTGGAFNFGEVTVTRAVVSLDTGETGFAYSLGRDSKKAECAAILHALWKTDRREEIEGAVIIPLESDIEQEKIKIREEVAPTKVDFFTLVRGDD